MGFVVSHASCLHQTTMPAYYLGVSTVHGGKDSPCLKRYEWSWRAAVLHWDTPFIIGGQMHHYNVYLSSFASAVDQPFAMEKKGFRSDKQFYLHVVG